MSYGGIASFAGAILSGCVAVLVLVMDRRSFAQRVFALGMAALALECFFSGLSLHAQTASESIAWHFRRLPATALIPFIWLLFSLCFAREDHKEFLYRWKWVLLAALAAPLLLVAGWWEPHYFASGLQNGSSDWVIPVGRAGYAFHICFLLMAVLIMINMERTLRASAGDIRRRIKYTAVGLLTLFAVRVYTSSQVLLFSTTSATPASVDAVAVVVADLLVLFSILRMRLSNVRLYISQELLSGSFTVLIVGGYLLAIGVVSAVAEHFAVTPAFIQRSFFVILGGVGVAAILLSGRLKQGVKRFVCRHFRHPRYEYRGLWLDFSRRTSSFLNSKDLCMSVANKVAETVGTDSVSIWLLDESLHRPVLAASTSALLTRGENVREMAREMGFLALTLREERKVIDLDPSRWARLRTIESSSRPKPLDGLVRYCVPLIAGNELLGILTLNERISGGTLAIEDIDLLQAVADQTAGLLLNQRLIERLGRARELEAFQMVSAFFVHDLKNVASTLSLMLQNLPVHYDNPDFRRDALRIVSNSVDKIKAMCGRLSLLKDRIELQCHECDLNRLLLDTIDGLNGSLDVPIVKELQPLPRLLLDADQMRKVIINLVLNAREAVGDDGEIRLATSSEGGTADLLVTDNGCGMSREFMEKSLFHPFRTTKDHGSGVGLFQSKMIVEAHRGWIEVESREGKGSTFRVVLPAN